MDFVVVGFGLGALGMLLGVLLRGWLAGRCQRVAAGATDPAVAAYEQANAAECRGAGQAFLAAGGAVVLATVGGLAGALSDRTGALLVATTATVAALGIMLWSYLYRSRNPLPPRVRRPKPLATTAVAPEVVVDDAASDRPAATAGWIASSDEPGPAKAAPFAQAPVAEASGEPDDTAADGGVPASKTDGSFGAEPVSAMGSPEADATTDAGASASAEESGSDVGAGANGHLADDEIGADETKVVAFVGRGQSASLEESAGPDDDAGDDR